MGAKFFVPEAVRKKLDPEELAGLEALERLLPDQSTLDELTAIAMSLDKLQLATIVALLHIGMAQGDAAKARELMCRQANIGAVARECIS